MGDYLANPMVQTPWGNSSELERAEVAPGRRYGARRGDPQPARPLVRGDGRGGLEKGYEATTVADLVALSGVSRSDFYKHFASKQACFVAMVEALVEPMLESITRAKVGADESRVREVFETFIGVAVEQGATARVCIVELHAAGEEAERAIDRVFDAFEELVLEASQRISGREGTPAQIVHAVIGGLRKVLHTRLYRGEERELARLAPQLWEWGLSYYPPPQPLRSRRRASGAPSGFEGYTPAERIARAVTAVAAEKGYQAMSTDDIAERASISLSTFYSHFANKRDAVLAALEAPRCWPRLCRPLRSGRPIGAKACGSPTRRCVHTWSPSLPSRDWLPSRLTRWGRRDWRGATG